MHLHERALDVLGDASLERLRVELKRMSSDRRAIPECRIEIAKARGERIDALFIEKLARDAFFNRLEGSAFSKRDHRSAAAHGFERRDSRIFDLRKDQRAATRVKLA